MTAGRPGVVVAPPSSQGSCAGSELAPRAEPRLGASRSPEPERGATGAAATVAVDALPPDPAPMSRESRIARAKARRRRQRRPWIVAGVVLVVVVAVAGVLLLGGSDDAGEAAAPGPCVAPSGELPEGAPEVPVRLGPPPTDLVVEDLMVGDGAEVQPGDTVTANYIGVACSTGEVFDSSYSRGEPTPFPLGQVIEGWQEGIPGMKVGGQRLLGIPPDQAYGAAGRPPSIGPNEALWFVVEVVETSSG